MSNTNKKQLKSGGSLAEDAGRLAIPLGLLLAKESLSDFLKKNSSTKAVSGASKKTPRTSVSRRVVSGGNDNTEYVVKAADGMNDTWAAAVPDLAVNGGKKKRSSKKTKK